MSTSLPPQGNEQTRPIPRVGSDGRTGPDHRELVARQKEEFGGMKFGAGFFGWLAATGMAVLLAALVTALAAAFGMSQNMTKADATAANAQKISLGVGIAVLAVVLVAYFAGGYVAGRMARFNGVKQGLAVWLWAIIIAVVLGALGAIAGSKYNVLDQVSLPNMGVSTDRFTWVGVLAAVVVAVVALLGAVLGGLAGMRFHRRVDKISLG